MAGRVAVVGSYGVGLTMRTSRLPQAGETLIGHGFSAGHGGKGSNQAVAAARLGAQVSLLTAVGSDSFGAEARRLWSDERVDASAVVVAQAATMAGVILVETSGENRIVIAPGALDELTVGHVDAFEASIAGADLLVTGFEIPPAAAIRALEVARRHGVRTLLNPAPALNEPLADDWWNLIDVITPNRTEVAALTGTEAAGPEESADALRRRFGGTMIITLGGDGCLVDDAVAGRWRVPATPASAVVDTTGAGDAFTGALAAALSRAHDLAHAVEFASAAAAFSVGIPEVIPSLPRPADLTSEPSEGDQRA